MEIKIGQINMARCAMGMEDLRTYLDKSDIQILMIQEPYACYNICWPGCRIFHAAFPDQDIWTITVVRDPRLSAVLNTTLSTDKCTVVEIGAIGGLETVVVNSYFKYNEDLEPHVLQLEKFLDMYTNRFVVVAADANARSTLWFNDDTDDRGTQLETLIIMRDLQIINRPSVLTTFENTRGCSSNIDVTLTTSSGRLGTEDWHVIG